MKRWRESALTKWISSDTLYTILFTAQAVIVLGLMVGLLCAVFLLGR